MTTDRELKAAIRAWLQADEHESPGGVLEWVANRIDDTPQVHSTNDGFLSLTHRTVNVGSLRLLAAGAAVLLVGFALGAARPEPSISGASASVPSGARTAGPDGQRYETSLGDTTLPSLRLSIPWPPNWGSWEQKIPAANYLSISTGGAQGAEAVFAWVYDFNAEPCYYLNQQPWTVRWADPAALATAMAEAPGMEVVTKPTQTSVDGRAAIHLVVRVTDDAGCDPGFFYSWPWWLGGSFWNETYPGDTVRVWVVDLDGKPLVLIAASHATADDSVERDFAQMVDGLRITTAR